MHILALKTEARRELEGFFKSFSAIDVYTIKLCSDLNAMYGSVGRFTKNELSLDDLVMDYHEAIAKLKSGEEDYQVAFENARDNIKKFATDVDAKYFIKKLNNPDMDEMDKGILVKEYGAWGKETNRMLDRLEVDQKNAKESLAGLIKNCERMKPLVEKGEKLDALKVELNKDLTDFKDDLYKYKKDIKYYIRDTYSRIFHRSKLPGFK